MKPRSLNNPGPLEPFDERDSVFARARLIPGDELHARYYESHPERLTPDERSRALPNLVSPDSRRFKPGEAALTEGLFAASDIVAAAVERGETAHETGTPDSLGAPSTGKLEMRLSDESPEGLSHYIKNAARFLGADDVGIAPLDPAFVYTHRGRPLSSYGNKVDLKHNHAIVLLFRMRHDFIKAAPEMIGTTETGRVYQQAAAACYALADALRRLGLGARAHVDSNYLVICPPLAVEAGLGELGRHGLLIHPVYGTELRLGVVTIDAEIACDAPSSWGVAAFCETCEKCSDLCPSAAIPAGDPVVVRGAEKWPLAAEKCYHYWRSQGTDCGICLRVCPFAKPDTILHRAVRRIAAKTTLFNRLFVKCDNWLYGASIDPRSVPTLER